jgi:ATP-dependent Lhr-like helicase
VNETLRDCLTEAMDAQGLKQKLEALFSGQIHRVARETPEPSVFSHEILNANPYAYLDDAPIEERRARAVSLRRGLPAELADDVGRLDPEAIAAVIEEARPDLRNADELHDLLLDLGALPSVEAAGWTAWLDELIASGRGARLDSGTRLFWVAAERRSLALAIWPDGRLTPDVAEPPARRAAPWSDREGALVELVRARLGLVGPTTAAALAEPFGLSVSSVNSALGRVEADGGVLRGRFTSTLAPDVIEWCDRRLLARIHRRTLARLRREIEPVSAADLMRFLFAWQHVKPGLQLHGRDGLATIIEQLEGFEVAAAGWEREIFPARVARYDPAWLDELCLSGEIAWGRLERHPSTRHAGRRLSGTVPITLLRRQNLAWLLEPRDGTGEEALSAPARDVLAHLRASGASFTDELAGRVRRLRIEVEEALCELVSAGLVTGDGFAGLRSLLHSEKRKRPRSGRARPLRAPIGTGRWALLDAPPPPVPDDLLEARARQYARRYGILFRDLLQREPGAPAWRDLLRVYRRLEMRGELRGGRIVGAFVGEQFALPEALSALRALRRDAPDGQVIRLSACDPLNLTGIITPGARVPAMLGQSVTYRDGVPESESGLDLRHSPSELEHPLTGAQGLS